MGGPGVSVAPTGQSLGASLGAESREAWEPSQACLSSRIPAWQGPESWAGGAATRSSSKRIWRKHDLLQGDGRLAVEPRAPSGERLPGAAATLLWCRPPSRHAAHGSQTVEPPLVHTLGSFPRKGSLQPGHAAKCPYDVLGDRATAPKRPCPERQVGCWP